MTDADREAKVYAIENRVGEIIAFVEEIERQTRASHPGESHD